MAFFDFIENFFFVSLGITFVLIILLVYHFKQRISSMERKGDTMYELITNVVKELQFMKKLNAYYETVFQNDTTAGETDTILNNTVSETSVSKPTVSETTVSETTVSETTVNVRSPTAEQERQRSVGLQGNSVEHSSNEFETINIVEERIPVDTPTTNNIVMNLCDPPASVNLNQSSRIVVSEDESSESDDEDSSDESDSDGSELEYDTDDSTEDEPATIRKRNDQTSQQPYPASVPIELNQIMEMIMENAGHGVSIEGLSSMMNQPTITESQRFAPYYENEVDDSNTYKPVIIETDDIDEFVKNTGREAGDVLTHQETPVEPELVELDVTELADELSIEKVVEDSPVQVEVEVKNAIVRSPIAEQEQSVGLQGNSVERSSNEFPEQPDKKQTRDVYRKMNITQLRGIALAAGISTDTTKMKKNELIHLLENLEE